MTAPVTGGVTYGERVARVLFDARGNHSEIHLSEAELAAIIDAAADKGVEFGYSPLKVQQERMRG